MSSTLKFSGFPATTLAKVRPWLPAALVAIERRTKKPVKSRTVYAMTDEEIADDKQIVEPGNPHGGGHGRYEADGTVKVNPYLNPHLTLLNVIHEILHGQLPKMSEADTDKMTALILRDIGALRSGPKKAKKVKAKTEGWDQQTPYGVSRLRRKTIGAVPLPLNRKPMKGEIVDPELYEDCQQRHASSLRDLVEDAAYRRLARKAPEFKVMKKHRVELTPEERKQCMDAKAVWHFNIGRDGKRKPTPAVWKAVLPDGTVWFNTNTHRAWNVASTLKGGIRRYHDFIKSTA